MHREFDPGFLGGGASHDHSHDHPHSHDHHHHHHHHHDHDPRAEWLWLVGVTAVVGALLTLDQLLAWGMPTAREPGGVSLALVAAVIGGGRVVYLAVLALLEGRIGADLALAVACVAAAWLREYFVAAEVVFIALVGECLEGYTFNRARAAIEASGRRVR